MTKVITVAAPHRSPGPERETAGPSGGCRDRPQGAGHGHGARKVVVEAVDGADEQTLRVLQQSPSRYPVTNFAGAPTASLTVSSAEPDFCLHGENTGSTTITAIHEDGREVSREFTVEELLLRTYQNRPYEQRGGVRSVLIPAEPPVPVLLLPIHASHPLFAGGDQIHPISEFRGFRGRISGTPTEQGILNLSREGNGNGKQKTSKKVAPGFPLTALVIHPVAAGSTGIRYDLTGAFDGIVRSWSLTVPIDVVDVNASYAELLNAAVDLESANVYLPGVTNRIGASLGTYVDGEYDAALNNLDSAINEFQIIVNADERLSPRQKFDQLALLLAEVRGQVIAAGSQ